MEEQVLDSQVTNSDHVDFDQKMNQVLQDGYQFNLGQYINTAFDIFKQYPGGFIGYLLLYVVITGIAGSIPLIGPLANLAIAPALTIGFALVAKKIYKGEPYTFNDFFGGFNFIGQLFLSNLITSIFVVIGIFLLVIPGIYLAVAYSFALLIIVFAKKEFWDAMEGSRKIITKNWWSFFAFVLVIVLLNIAGALLLLVGLLVTVPVSYIAFYAAYEDIIGTKIGD